MSTPQEQDARAIDVTSLVKVYRGDVRAVDGIDLEVHPGEIYGFLGPNGAGKSTTVHILTTLLPLTSGRAFVGGYDVVREAHRVRGIVGAALQEVALDPHLTGRDHVRLQGALHGLPGPTRRRRGDELLARMGLAEAAGRKVGAYSGGMKRRLDLALALVHRPSILFLDEPTTGLDIQSRKALWGEVRRLAREDGVTVLLTTQYLEEADTLADRVGIIDRGKIVAEGTTAALKAEIGQPTVEVSPSDPSDESRIIAVLEGFGEIHDGRSGAVAVRVADKGGLAAIVRSLDEKGIVVEDVSLHAPTLDDVFLEKTGRSLEGAGAPAAEPE